MQKNMLMAVGGGSISAVASMAFFAGFPGALLFVYVAMLPLFLVAFSMGHVAGLIACASGLVITLGLGGVINAGSFGILHALPAWLVSRQWLGSSDSDNQGAVVSVVSLGPVLGLVSLAGASLVLAGAVYIGGDVQSAIQTHITEVFSVLGLDLQFSEISQLKDSLVAVFPAAMGVSWVVMTMVNALLAQYILSRAGKSVVSSPSFSTMELPQWVAVPMIASAVAALTLGGDLRYLAQNLTIILAVPYFFLGLSVSHWAIGQVQAFRGMLFTGFYFILMISGWALAIVAALGMAEQWFGVRSRFSQQDNYQGPKDRE